MNESAPLVSVIIPVFNKHKYLHKCLHSLLNQTYTNIEVIVVDDCSTDASFAKAKRLLEDTQEAILVRNDTNKGLLKSRYVGISKAHGVYTAFMDADDWMEARAIETMVEAMTEFKADLVQLRNRQRMRGVAVKYQEHFDPALASRLIDGNEFRSLASYVGMDSYIYPSCWGKMYITSKLREATQIDFDQFWGEDQIFNIQYLRECRSMAFCDYVGYNYRWGGTTSAYKYSALREYKHVHQLKRMLGQDEGRINAEIKMLLRYHVRSLITELGYTAEAVAMILEDELRDPLWRRVGETATPIQLVEQEMANIQRSPVKYIAKRLLR